IERIRGYIAETDGKCFDEIRCLSRRRLKTERIFGRLVNVAGDRAMFRVFVNYDRPFLFARYRIKRVCAGLQVISRYLYIFGKRQLCRSIRSRAPSLTERHKPAEDLAAFGAW